MSSKQTNKRRGTSRPPASRPARTSRSPREARADASAPEITIKQAPVGRETLAAIEEELANGFRPFPRPQIDTIRYEDRPKERPSRASVISPPPSLTTISQTSTP